MNAATDRKPYRIHVGGDIVVDHHIYQGDRLRPIAHGPATSIQREKGGAGLTADLLALLCRSEPRLGVFDTTPVITRRQRPDPALHQAFATWTPAPVRRGDKKPKVWRVREKLGFGTVEIDVVPTSSDTALLTSPCDVFVIDEGGLGYRNRSTQWPSFLTENTDVAPPWVVLKMSAPICNGELWAQLDQARFHDRLVVLVSADDLRRCGAAVSHGLSWEKSIQELLGDLTYNAALSPLLNARHLIVSFEHEGALWVDNSDAENPRRSLIFDPKYLEGSMREEVDGMVFGMGACLTASIARALFENASDEDAEADAEGQKPSTMQLTEGADLDAGIKRGLAARRALLLHGHGPADGNAPGFPFSSLLEALQGSRGADLRSVAVPAFAIPAAPGSPREAKPDWSIIVGNPCEGYRPLFGLARNVAVKGEDALKGIPYGRFGKLYTVDRIELNGFYGIRKLIKEYVEEHNPDKPLSMGVFGPPGAGKSFGLKQIVRSILGADSPILTFNLSQFTGPEMLIGALHQVRDEVLRGKVPVAFWDEFDSRSLFWLQYMLAPMNDGEFLEGQVTHPIGKCIFVFAGGTCDNLDDFCSRSPGKETDEFVNAKGPDFVSRLRGYLNVLGPNPRLVAGKADPGDVGYPIRRAIMLRVLADHFGSRRLEIDPGLLNAMLKVSEFKHGARSMETVIKLTTGNGKRTLMRSNLPPREQLNLHVDFDEFMGLVQADMMFKLQTKELAPHIHGFYLELAEQEGWNVEYSGPYEELPERIKEDNISAARRLPNVLALAGLIVVDSQHGPGAAPDLVREIIEENLDLLAEAEHDGWMETKIANGWRLDEKRDDRKKRHPSLIPFNDLREDDKVKDRNAVRHYPDIIKRAEFLIRLEGVEE